MSSQPFGLVGWAPAHLVRDLKQKSVCDTLCEGGQETYRVRFVHHCKPNTSGFLLQMTPFWCAERTLPSSFQTLLCTEGKFISHLLVTHV
jgi:hypothetical protein